jgi:phosphocarrier protein HPr
MGDQLEIRDEVTIMNRLGLHARPAASLVQAVLPFQCEVHLCVNGQQVNAKSIMGLLTLAAAQGTKIEVICRGDDATEALNAVRSLIESRFGED